MKIEFNVHTLGESGRSDRISVGAIAGNSCQAADGASTADGNKIRQGLEIIGFQRLPFLLSVRVTSPWKDAYFSKHIPNCIGTGSEIIGGSEPEGKKWGNSMCDELNWDKKKLWWGETPSESQGIPELSCFQQVWGLTMGNLHRCVNFCLRMNSLNLSCLRTSL